MRTPQTSVKTKPPNESGSPVAGLSGQSHVTLDGLASPGMPPSYSRSPGKQDGSTQGGVSKEKFSFLERFLSVHGVLGIYVYLVDLFVIQSKGFSNA